MGYRAEKEKIEGKIKRIKTVALCITLGVLLALCIFSAFVPPDTWKYHVGKPSVPRRLAGEMRIHFLDVGQGDCAIIELPDGKVALIDGGDGRESTEITVLRYLNALNVDVIDYLIVSHADSDHCGSLDKVLEHKKVLNAYLPTAKPENSNTQYAQFYARLLEEDCALRYSEGFTTLSNTSEENGYTFAFLYPHLYNEEEIDEEDNATSSVLWLDYRGVSTLFTGDAPKAVENTIITDDRLGLFDFCDVELDSTEILKVSHHGSADATSAAFLQYLQVETAVISCSKNNPYGHPTQETLNHLSEVGADVYRTDRQGVVVVTVKKDGSYSVGSAN